MDNKINKEQIKLNLAPTSESDLALGKERFTNEHIYESPIKDLLSYGLTPDQIRSSYAEHILYLAIRIKCDVELSLNYKPQVNKDLDNIIKSKTDEELIEEILGIMKQIDDAHESGSGMSLEDLLNKLKEFDPELVKRCGDMRRSAMYKQPRPQWFGQHVA